MFDRLWAAYPHTTLAASGEAVGLPAGPDGQLGGRAPDDRRRPPPLPGSDANQQGDRGRLVLRERCPPRSLRARRERPPAGSRLQRRRPFAHRPPARAASLRAREDLDPRVHGRTRRVAALRGQRPGRAADRTHRHRLRPLLRDGSRPALGAHAARVRRNNGVRPRDRGVRPRRSRAGELRPTA